MSRCFSNHAAYPTVRPGPLHSILLAGAVPLFLGALLSDIAYGQTYQIQWANFASWLIAGALVFSGFALLFALVNLLRPLLDPYRRYRHAKLIHAVRVSIGLLATILLTSTWAPNGSGWPQLMSTEER